QHFSGRLARRYGREIVLSRGAIELLLGYGFPGNVRELESLLESAAAVSAEDPQIITEKDLRPQLSDVNADTSLAAAMNQPLSMEQMERLTIQQALRLAEGNRTKAASL